MSRRQVLIEALEATPRDLARMLRPVTDELALRRPASGGWCIVELVAHLGYTEELMLARVRRVAAEDTPTVEVIEDGSGHDTALPLAEHLARFLERREATLAFLRGLGQAQWARPLIHPESGPARLRDQVQALVDHDSEHLAEILRLRETP